MGEIIEKYGGDFYMIRTAFIALFMTVVLCSIAVATNVSRSKAAQTIISPIPEDQMVKP